MNQNALEALTYLEQTHSLVGIIEIVPNCGSQPIRFACFLSSLEAGLRGIIVGNNYPAGNVPCHLLHVSCAEADVNCIAHLYGAHDSPDAESSSIPLAENRHAFCIKREGCPLGRLTLEKLFLPLFVDQLAPNQKTTFSHRQH
jgi:hypothetical protein